MAVIRPFPQPQDGDNLEDFLPDLIDTTNARPDGVIDISGFPEESIIIKRGNRAAAFELQNGQLPLIIARQLANSNFTSSGYVYRNASGTFETRE